MMKRDTITTVSSFFVDKNLIFNYIVPILQEEYMGFFSRLATFFRIRANAALDKAEDPGQVMDYSYSKQLEQLQQIKRSVADVATNEKRLELLQAELLGRVNKLDSQAMQALQANREDLARMALQRKETLIPQLNGY